MEGAAGLKRILGLDYGSKTVGVAVSDPLLITAQGVEIIRRKSENKLRQTLARIEQLIKEYNAEQIVLGLPVHMNNDLSDRARKSLEFKEMLERRTGLSVVMWDERLTTAEAIDVLNEAKVPAKDRKKYVDKLAAVFILQDYLNYIGSGRG
jgi:putative Holliday junction resolvase